MKPGSVSPALAAQHHHHQPVPSDAQGEDECIDHRQKDPLKLCGHDVLHIARLLQVHAQVTRTGTRARAGVVEVKL